MVNIGTAAGEPQAQQHQLKIGPRGREGNNTCFEDMYGYWHLREV
jgi:hypothetical protein